MTQLAPFAVTLAQSRGRAHDESAAVARGEFQRDRDRIVHCSAYRRLQYKTQVFVNHEGDMFRTRLTHSLEVAQISRSLARNLLLNEDLVESISLAHDLGHTPFGHCGQDALNACMKDFGGFEHNEQSLRVVDLLEERYGSFDGLNLMFETREGILKHCSAKRAENLGEVAERFVKNFRPSLEAQLCNLADELAYNNHDIDDGLRSGFLLKEELEEIPLFGRASCEVHQLYPDLKGRDRRYTAEVVRRMINTQCLDFLAQTRTNIACHNPANLVELRQAPPLASFSEKMQEDILLLRKFLRQNLYLHHRVMRMNHKSHLIIEKLFAAFMHDHRLLPTDHQRRVNELGARAIADYIAGMTDRYAMREYRQLYEVGAGDALI